MWFDSENSRLNTVVKGSNSGMPGTGRHFYVNLLPQKFTICANSDSHNVRVEVLAFVIAEDSSSYVLGLMSIRNGNHLFLVS